MSVHLPFWFTTFVPLALPAVAVAQSLRRRRVRRCVTQGLCLACRYDLRASPDRCPECGTVIDRQRVAPRREWRLWLGLTLGTSAVLGVAVWQWKVNGPAFNVPVPKRDPYADRAPSRGRPAAASAPTAVAPPRKPPATGPVNTPHTLTEESLFMRNENGRLIHDVLPGKTAVILVKRQGQWSVVRTADGRVGLVHTAKLDPPPARAEE